VVRQQNGALVVAPDALFLDRRVQIADFATRYRIPTMYELRNYVEAGGLISYGATSLDLYRQGGALTGQILMGKKPADLPVRQPTKFELGREPINLPGGRLARVRYAPIATNSAAQRNDAVCQTRKSPHYSITSSARASNVGGIGSLLALAVLRFTINSNRAGRSMGISAGRLPLRILST
jgi:hypothetical protein